MLDAEELAGRGAVEAVTPHGDPCTVVVARHGIGRTSRIVIALHGTWIGAAVLTLAQADKLAEAIEKARAPLP